MSALLHSEPGPGTLKATRWGGARLGPLRGGAAGIGESWEFSTLPGAESRVAGEPLSAILGGPLEFLAKLLDTALPLSVQVHPADDPVAGIVGKEEAWIILDADPDAAVLVGLAPGVSRRDLEGALARADAEPDAVIDCLHRIPARRGMVILVPARTLHAIGAGVLLAEIQQPVDCTYRLHDYGSGRALHVSQALATLDPGARPRVYRPGDAPGIIAGAHLRLTVIEEGEHAIAAERAAPRLLVPVSSCACDDEPLAAGDLALAIAPCRVRVPAGGQLVVGALPW
ncbi:MAG: class I mannose-6-phosphate isomerase [Myxococcales bacterium]|nr:class I mannose-6-phosphate isomerase [Myxococcales bacterium]